jgi:response regulator NasT
LLRDIKAASGHEPLRILVIDRNPERAGIVERALRESGDYLVEISPGAGHLLELLRIMQPDVLIVDLDLPDRDTIEQLRVATREMPRPIIMFVDQSDTETMRAAVSAGVSAYVVDGLQAKRVKPILDVAVVRFQEFEALRRELELAKTSLAERKLIDRAKGILMRARGLSEDEAYGLLRRKAMHDQKKVIEIAQSVITAAELLK